MTKEQSCVENIILNVFPGKYNESPSIRSFQVESFLRINIFKCKSIEIRERYSLAIIPDNVGIRFASSQYHAEIPSVLISIQAYFAYRNSKSSIISKKPKTTKAA